MLDKYPLVSDCSELYSLGFTREGQYDIQVDGQTVKAFCQNSWTIILKRGQFGNTAVGSYSTNKQKFPLTDVLILEPFL